VAGSTDAVAKPPRGVSLYSRFLNRPAGRRIAVVAVRLGWSANVVSGVSAALSLAALVWLVLVPPDPVQGVAVALLLALGFAFDSADGQVARMSRTSSPAGEWLDHVIDAGRTVLLHAAVGVAWFRFLDQEDAWLLVPLGFQFVAVVMFSALTIVSLLKGPAVEGVSEAPSRTRAIALLPADFGIIAWSFVLWGFPETFRAFYTVLAALNAVILALMLVKWYGELRALRGQQGPGQAVTPGLPG
jgi:phosphatidylglycerophosphate synthase